MNAERERDVDTQLINVAAIAQNLPTDRVLLLLPQPLRLTLVDPLRLTLVDPTRDL